LYLIVVLNVRANNVAAFPKKLFYRIQEVSEIVGVEPYVLRYWETRFPEAAPEKDDNDQRRYRQAHVEKLLRIRELLYDEKYTIPGAAERLKDESAKGGMAAKTPRPKARPALDNDGADDPANQPDLEQIAQLKRELGLIRRELEEWRDELSG
jgi:DNA-binding transcriptional MerR regulator